MISVNDWGITSYDVKAQRPSLYSWGNTSTRSIVGRAMVIYAEEDDFGANPLDYDSFYFGGMTTALACCNIRRFKIVVAEDDKDLNIDGGRKLESEDFEDVEYLNPDQYKEIFGVEYDPEDWNLEKLTQ